MNDKTKEILKGINVVIKHDGTLEFNSKELKILLDYITNLQTISDNRMNALLEIEQYCNDEKEDLISGGEVCEDVLKIIDELKGK